MSELVDRQEVLKIIRGMNLPLDGYSDTEALLDAIKGLSAIEIMVCKDCRYNGGNGGRCCHYDATRFFVDEQHRPFYCKYGMEKEKDNG